MGISTSVFTAMCLAKSGVSSRNFFAYSARFATTCVSSFHAAMLAAATGPAIAEPLNERRCKNLAMMSASPAAKPERRPGAFERFDKLPIDTKRLKSVRPMSAATCSAPTGALPSSK